MCEQKQNPPQDKNAQFPSQDFEKHSTFYHYFYTSLLPKSPLGNFSSKIYTITPIIG